MQYGASTAYSNKLNENIKLLGTANMRWYKGHHYQTVADLLGADYWLDIDQFAERDFADADIAQSDIDNPNNVTGVGDIIGYDYDANINAYDVNGQAEFSYAKIDGFAAGKLSYTEFWRTGNRRNGKFPTESFGDAPKQQFFDYGMKAGLTYKITGRHFLILNAAALTEAPYFWDAYVSARTRDHVVNNLQSEKIMAVDLSYVWRSPYVDARLTGYYTDFKESFVYPNPFSSTATLVLNNKFEGNITIKIFNKLFNSIINSIYLVNIFNTSNSFSLLKSLNVFFT
jgi:hypothetical protein